MSISNGLHPHRDNATDDEDDGDDGFAAHDAYYHPISAFDDGSDPNSNSDVASGGIVEAASPIRSNGGALFHLRNPDPSFLFLDAESGISALDLNGGGDGVGGSSGGLVEEVVEDEEAEEESVRQREVSISRAFREDETRRSAPLTPENAARVLDAMRGVAFQGVPPDWAERVPEDQWVARLRRMRVIWQGFRFFDPKDRMLDIVKHQINSMVCNKSDVSRDKIEVLNTSFTVTSKRGMGLKGVVDYRHGPQGSHDW